MAKEGAFPGLSHWQTASCEPLTGDASARKYFRLRAENKTVILMDASRVPDSIAPFIRIAEHLRQIDFSAPEILARDTEKGLLLLEDFGDNNFAQLLEKPDAAENLFALATDVLIALHKNPRAVPKHLPSYSPEIMLADLELFLEWRTPDISSAARGEFHAAWREVLPLAHCVPASLLLRDFHVANLMLLPAREGVRQVGLLDFQDAYRGPVTYDLVSLLEDARRDVPEPLRERMLSRYAAQFPALNQNVFETSLAVIAALRHTRILAIFERLARRDNRDEYWKLHSPRVERLLQRALCHPALNTVAHWMKRHVAKN